MQLCLWLSQNYKYYEFREVEVRSLIELTGISPSFTNFRAIPDRIVLVDAADASSVQTLVDCITARSICVKYIIEAWAVAASKEELRSKVKTGQGCAITIPQFRALIKTSFAWLCESAGKSTDIPERVKWMNEYGFLFKGTEPADLKNPGITFVLLEDFTNQQYVFGRLIKTRPVGVEHRLARRYALSARPILGPTTLDNSLAFLLCNLGQIQEGTVVLDPFCGTGGLLIAASECGAICFGSDLDGRVLRGWAIAHDNEKADMKAANKSIFANFSHYELARPTIGRINVGESTWRDGEWVDVILTDPPYGIRANAVTTADTDREASFNVVRSVTNIVSIFKDLFHTAQKVLKRGGLLVSLVPVNDATKEDELALIMALAVAKGFHMSMPPTYQLFQGGLGRFAITVRKEKNR